MSTSIAAARYLARDLESPARRMSLFLNPSGSDLVLLAEGSQRAITLDGLEMQYYRQLIHEPDLTSHLQLPDAQVRYGRSCRDLSVALPGDLVTLHASVGSRGLRNAAAQDEAQIIIWQTHGDDLEINARRFSPVPAIEQRVGDWIVWTDEWVLSRVRSARTDKLPNETGGVLIGSFDLQRKIVYIVGVLDSPPDSSEWPTSYIRGAEGLADQLASITRVTAGMVEYVGEWHSHPDSYGPMPSSDDRKAFGWLTQHMELDGLPALMLIVAHDGQYSWYVDHMG